MSITKEEFVERVISAGVAERMDVSRAIGELGVGEVTLPQVVDHLQSRGLITTLQTEKIMRGDRVGYFYGDFKILYLIGAGTFARVYRAEKDGQVFAVKVLRKRFRDEAHELEQFLREGRMGLKLKHPNIVRILEVVPDRHNPFLVMEFVEGQTLRELVKIRGKLPVELSLKLMHEIAQGLAFAASLGISHRDLKLSNVLISSGGVAKLVDFGLAALADRSNPEVVADCPNARAIDYAALERGTNVRKDDPRSDVFFAGNMLYHMLAGTPALTETRDRMARLNISRFQDIRSIYDYVPDLPGIVNQLLLAAMEFNPEKRIQTCTALATATKKVIDTLEQGPAEARAPDLSGKVNAEDVGDDHVITNEGEGYVVMFVESKAGLQNAVRDRLKARGYRVLIIANPQRALDRFVDAIDKPADCVIFGAAELGNDALEAYNAFSENEDTKEIPAILLVDPNQKHLIQRAVRGSHRALLPLPLSVKHLRIALIKLLADTEPRSEALF
ncbi:serine/threonine-protein kinase [Allorhodopirellula heiligendammensis]|uniref:non-specific serine/threonine protein kinase n=1 Tax=Allorhodopirellula heiligendammensis TaxID=2714739 RepID=A0A5C6BDV8_9BACT|nr:serine/threonine-protein kinase [Allorhodopirellula heiligendammensis]TWU10160.1 Serine/threonine-protein kinase PrkC [Allorhodopirellula heiligendammensis]